MIIKYRGQEYTLKDEEIKKGSPLNIIEVVSAKLAHKYFTFGEQEYIDEVNRMVRLWTEQADQPTVVL